MRSPFSFLLLCYLSCPLWIDKNTKHDLGDVAFCASVYIYELLLCNFTFILSFLCGLQASPLSAHQSTELSEREVRVLGLDDGSHLAAEKDVAAHVDLPLCPLLL